MAELVTGADVIAWVARTANHYAPSNETTIVMAERKLAQVFSAYASLRRGRPELFGFAVPAQMHAQVAVPCTAILEGVIEEWRGEIARFGVDGVQAFEHMREQIGLALGSGAFDPFKSQEFDPSTTAQAPLDPMMFEGSRTEVPFEWAATEVPGDWAFDPNASGENTAPFALVEPRPQIEKAARKLVELLRDERTLTRTWQAATRGHRDEAVGCVIAPPRKDLDAAVLALAERGVTVPPELVALYRVCDGITIAWCACDALGRPDLEELDEENQLFCPFDGVFAHLDVDAPAEVIIGYASSSWWSYDRVTGRVWDRDREHAHASLLAHLEYLIDTYALGIRADGSPCPCSSQVAYTD